MRCHPMVQAYCDDLLLIAHPLPQFLEYAAAIARYLFFFELYSHFNVRTGSQPSITVMRMDKCSWLSLALCEGCSHGGTLELTLSWMGRVAEN